MLEPPPRPLPSLAYVGAPLERVTEKRGDKAFVAAAAAHPDACAILVGGETVLLRKTPAGEFDALFRFSEIEALGAGSERVFLGLAGSAGWFAAAIAPERAQKLKEKAGLFVINLRSIAMQGLLQPEQLQAVAAAKALLTWHARHGFCAHCGERTQPAEAGWRRDCAGCGAQHFPRTDPCVIMLVIDGERCLLARSKRFVATVWSCLAGFVEPGESLEEAVRRETREEAGVMVGRVAYFGSQPWPFPMSMMLGCFAEAIGTELNIDRDELEDARWMSRDEAASMLAGKHKDGLTTPPPVAIAHHIIRAFVERGADVLRRPAP